MSRARTVRAVLGAALAAVTAAAVLLLPGTQAWPAQPAPPAGPVVLAGVGALRWADADPAATPTLWALADDHSVASLSVKSVRRTTCLVDGWLTISAGRRAFDVEREWCRPVPRPLSNRDAAGTITAGEWDALVAAQDEYLYDAQPGLLGDTLAAAGVCATAVGPGASLALARSDGSVDRYIASADQLDGAVLEECPVTVVDLGWLPRAESGEQRRAEARRVDERLARLQQILPGDATLLVAGVSDSGPTVRAEALPADDSGEPTDEEPDPNAEAPILSPEDVFPFPPPGLRLAAADGTDLAGEPYAGTWLTSASTRWTGMVQLTDITPTLLTYAGADRPTTLVGQPWRQAGPHPDDPAATVEELVGSDTAAQIFRTQSGRFFQWLGALEISLAALALLLLLHRPADRRGGVLRGTFVGALLSASFPVASFLANTVRWWLTGSATLVLWMAIAAWATAVTALAALGPWRRRVYGPPGVVAGVTVAVLAADVVTGSNLQHSSLLGLSPLVAGRFYGLGNIPFAIYSACALVLAGALAQAVIDAGRSRRAAAMTALAVGAVAVVVNGAPAAGADFGGMLALSPAVAVLVFGAGAWQPSPRRVLAVGLVSVGVVAAISVLDWLRPPDDRSHLGDFVQDVVDGDAVVVVLRKAAASWSTLNPARGIYGWLAVVALVAVVLLLRDPARWRASGLLHAFDHWPMLRPTMWAGVTVAVTGFLVNDSGIVIPALVLTVGIPLVVAAVAAARLAGPAPAARTPEAAEVTTQEDEDRVRER